MLIQQAAQKYFGLQNNITQACAEFIDLDQASFEASMKEAMANPEIAAEMKKNEENARLICEPPRKEPLSKDKVKAILIEKA